MDEGFITLKEEKQIKKFRCRITTFNTGFNLKECKYNRKVLANNRGFVILKEQKTGKINTEDYVQRILMELERYYILPKKLKLLLAVMVMAELWKHLLFKSQICFRSISFCQRIKKIFFKRKNNPRKNKYL